MRKTKLKSLSMKLMAMLVVICMVFPMVASATEVKVSELQGFNLSNLKIDVDYMGNPMPIDLSSLAIEAMYGISEELNRVLLSSSVSVQDKAAATLAIDVSEKDTLLAVANSLLKFPTDKMSEALAKLDPSFAEMGDAIQLSPAKIIEQFKSMNESVEYNSEATDKIFAHLALNYAPLFIDLTKSDVTEGSEKISFKGNEYDTTYTKVVVKKEDLSKIIVSVIDKFVADEELFALLAEANITFTAASMKEMLAEVKDNADEMYNSDMTVVTYTMGEQFVGLTETFEVKLDAEKSGRADISFFTFGEGDNASNEGNFSIADVSGSGEGIFAKMDYTPAVSGEDMSGTLNMSFNVMSLEEVPVYTAEDQKKLDDFNDGKDVDITGIVATGSEEKLLETVAFTTNNEFAIAGYKAEIPSSITFKGDVNMTAEGTPVSFGYTLDFAGDANNGTYGFGITTSEDLATTLTLKGDYAKKDATASENGSNTANFTLDVSSMGIGANVTSKYDGVIALDADGVTTGEQGKYSLLIDVPMLTSSANLTCDTYLVKGPMSEDYFINAGDTVVNDVMTMTDEQLTVVKGEIMTELTKLLTAIGEIPSLQTLLAGNI